MISDVEQRVDAWPLDIIDLRKAHAGLLLEPRNEASHKVFPRERIVKFAHASHRFPFLQMIQKQ